MFTKTPFYHQCVRKTVVAFGSLFNNLYIGGDRVENPAQRIPLSYAPKQKWYRRLSESRMEDGSNFSTTLPRMGFALTTWEYDSSRKRTTMSKKVRPPGTAGVEELYPLATAATEAQYRFAEVPYTFTFELYIMPDTMDNGLRIVEQILPYFTPSYTISLNYTNIDRKVDVPVTLTSVGWEDEYEGNFESGRVMMYTMTFEVQSYVYGPVRDAKFILETQASVHNIDDLGLSRAETRDYVRLWDRAVEVGTTGPSAPLSLTGTEYDVWQEKQLFEDVDSAWGAE
jgi:hypothetical protein